MDKKIIIGGGAAIGLLVIGSVLLATRKKKKQERTNSDFSDFKAKLTNVKEPEKINRAVLQQAFDPEYWKEARGSAIVSQSKANELANAIYDAWDSGWFWDDDEDAVYQAFEDQSLTSFADVSRVADAYRSDSVAGKDLWKHLEYKLSEDEFAQVKGIVSQKDAA